MQIILRCEPAQRLEHIDAGYALLQRTPIKARGNEQRDSVGDHQVGVIVNLLQASFLFQQDNVLRVGSNNICRLTPIQRVGDDRRAHLLRRAVVDQSVAYADATYIRPAERGVRGMPGGSCRKPLRVDIHVSTLKNPSTVPVPLRRSCRAEMKNDTATT